MSYSRKKEFERRCELICPECATTLIYGSGLGLVRVRYRPRYTFLTVATTTDLLPKFWVRSSSSDSEEEAIRPPTIIIILLVAAASCCRLCTLFCLNFRFVRYSAQYFYPGIGYAHRRNTRVWVFVRSFNIQRYVDYMDGYMVPTTVWIHFRIGWIF